MRTPFGIIYNKINNEVVDYPVKHAPGTIVVNTSERRLYYVLGDGKAIRYGIAVGMEGYGWDGREHGLHEARMAGLDADARHPGALPQSAPAYGWRSG